MSEQTDDLRAEEPPRVNPPWIITIHEQSPGACTVAVTDMATGRETHFIAAGQSTMERVTLDFLVNRFARSFSNEEGE